MQQIDVLILGGGIAGAAAALAARSAGAATTLVRSGPGATALAAGGWTGTAPDPVLDALARAGLPLESCSGPLPHPDGRLVAADMAPASHAHAAFSSGAELALVCDIDGLPGFRARALARLWTHAAGLRDHAIEAASLTLADTPAAGWSPVSLAALLEREPHRLAAPLAHAVRDHGAARVLLPPVLGAAEHARVHAALCDAVRVRVGECLGTAPSLPGQRLNRALLQALATAGVAVVNGRASERPGSGRRVVVHGPRGEQTLVARAVVLATGRFIGGGITADPHLQEPTLGMAVAVLRGGSRYTDARQFELVTDPVWTAPQPILSAGVVSDDSGRLVDAGTDGAAAMADGGPALFAAGAVRAGGPASTPGLGHAARDGWAAGLLAASAAAEAN